MKHVSRARPYEVGASVSSVELLLDARTAAEGAAALATERLVGQTGIDGPLEVQLAVPGPARWEGARRFAVEARSGLLGALFCQDALISVLADLIMGGRGVSGDEPPSDLEINLFTQRVCGVAGIVLDAVQPGRPEPITLIERDYETPARSVVVEATVTHRDEAHPLKFEVLAHHVADDQQEVDDSRMAEICHEVSLPLSFRYSPITLHASDVAALEPGDVICLEHDIDAPVTGAVGERALLKGAPGRVGRRAGVEIVDLIEREV